jgi:hypothetical protein
LFCVFGSLCNYLIAACEGQEENDRYFHMWFRVNVINAGSRYSAAPSVTRWQGAFNGIL